LLIGSPREAIHDEDRCFVVDAGPLVGEAHDIAQAYLFLMQEEFSTGQTLVVDRGTVLV
jgi:hypothetical protein